MKTILVSKKAKKALEESIKHYERMVVGKDLYIEGTHCACRRAAADFCQGCAIDKFVEGGCYGSPWIKLSRHARTHNITHSILVGCPECKRLVKRVLAFLRKVLRACRLRGEER